MVRLEKQSVYLLAADEKGLACKSDQRRTDQKRERGTVGLVRCQRKSDYVAVFVLAAAERRGNVGMGGG